MWVFVWAWCVLGAAAAGGRYSSRIVRTSAGAVRGILRAGDGGPVEVFLGVRYGEPPARLAPTPASLTPAATRVLLADTPPPACPQPPPPAPVLPEHLPHLPYINNTSEDCLFLNIYVPGSGSRGVDAPYPVVLWLGAPSFTWGSGSAYDGTVLAATHHVIFVTLNYRLGLLGFLTCTEGPDCAKLESSGGAGFEDIAAAARWMKHNAPALGGDPNRIYLTGHRHGAALAHHLLAKDDLQGVVAGAILLSGSGLAPWASAPSPSLTREAVAKALHCQQNETTHHEDWLVSCIRSRPLEALISVAPPSGRFLGVWPPAPKTSLISRLVTAPLHRAARLLLVLTNTDGYDHYDEHEINHGFEEEHRNRILRTFVRNVYKYHRAEIYAAIRNEYTWWERPVQHPVWTRGATSDATSDGGDAAPATRAALTHAHSHKHTLFAVFGHRSQPAHTPQRLGSASYETLWHFLGVPLLETVDEESGSSPTNRWSRADLGVAGSCTALLARFVRGGPLEEWPDYTQHDQHYLHIGTKLKVKSHYRGHKMALWLNLIPQLHRPGAHPAHHDFAPEPDLYAGEIYPEEPAPPPSPPPAPSECVSSTPLEDPSPSSSVTSPDVTAPSVRMQEQYDYRYSPAVVGSVGAGCVLAALNLLVLLGLYITRHRENRKQKNRRGAASSRCESEVLTLDPSSTTTPRKSSLKRSSEAELKERPQICGTVATKKRVQIQEISV